MQTSQRTVDKPLLYVNLIRHIIDSMTKNDLLLTMFNQRNNFNPPLQAKEIIEFAEHELSDQKDHEKFYERAEYLNKLQEANKKWHFVNYVTKKELNQALKETNAEIREWMDRKRKNIGFLYDVKIEECTEKKRKIQGRLKNFQKIKENHGREKEMAKSIPIDQYIEFQSGFAQCVFHSEKTGSMKYYPKDNHVFCFSCKKRGDVIDVVMAKFNLNFVEAIKLILNK